MFVSYHYCATSKNRLNILALASIYLINQTFQMISKHIAKKKIQFNYDKMLVNVNGSILKQNKMLVI